MAAKIQFKQQCPSCEAMVPIRDVKLVGRKIDCPKCKYRFVVEEPEEEDDDEEEEEAPAKKTGITNKKPAGGKAAPKRRDDDEEEAKPKKKKSGGNSSMVVIGIALAAVAVVALAIGGWLLFGGGDSDKPTTSNPRPIAANNPQAPGAEVQTAAAAETKKDPPKPRIEDVTNLLPNETQIVYNLPVRRLFGNNAFRKAALLTAGAFLESDFLRTWGVPATEIKRVVMGINVEKQSVFSVMQLAQPIDEDQIVAALRLKAEEPINGKNYYLVKRPLDSLTTFLLKKNEARDRVALHFLDSFTVVCSEPAMVQQFLKDKGQPKRLTQAPVVAANPADGKGAPGAAPGGPPGAAPGGPAGAPPPPRPGGPQGAAQGAPPPARPGGSPGAPPPPNPPGAAQGAPPPARPGGPGAPGRAGQFQPPNMPGAMPGMRPGGGGNDLQPAAVSSSYMTVDPHLKAVLDQAEKTDANEGQVLLFSVAVDSSLLPENVKQFQEGHSAPGLLARFLLRNKLVFKSDIKAVAFGLTALGGEKFSRTLAWESKNGKTVDKVEKEVKDALEKIFERDDLDMVAKDAKNNNNNNANRPGGPGGPAMPPGVGFPPQGGGPGQPGRFQQPGGFQQPRGPGFPGGPNANGEEDDKDAKKGKDGDYYVWNKDQVVAASINRTLKAEEGKDIAKWLVERCKLLRAGADMCNRRSHIHELAAAMLAYVEKEGHFPRGTVARPLDGQRFLDWRPDQRVSWMVSLLGYIADGRFKRLGVKSEQAWNEGDNLNAASTVIPQFVAPQPSGRAKPYYYVAYPVAERKTLLAASHFVGVAGVGLDAAEYAVGDASKAKLRGVFGYDRETKPDEIKDGLAETIALLQVPPTPRGPWIAGGGSTVRGVSSDDDCFQSFVSTEYDGKPGTFAVMADGKVRFLPASIDPKTFRAMCTIAGGEKIKNLDDIAPEVPEPEKPPELKATQPVLLAEQTPAAKPGGWTEYVSKKGRFAVSLPPGKSFEQKQQLTLPTGKVDLHIYGVVLPGDIGVFITIYSDQPDAVIAAGADKIFAGAKVSTAARLGKGAKITKEAKIAIDGHPGREWTLEIPKQGSMKIHVFLVKNRLYHLLVGGDFKKVAEKDVQKFFDSFKLTGK